MTKIRNKVRQDYEANPPACRLCVNFLREKKTARTTTTKCKLGQFAVNPGGICDCWKGHDGSVLESEPVIQAREPLKPHSVCIPTRYYTHDK